MSCALLLALNACVCFAQLSVQFCRLSLDERVAICSSVGEEVLQESELRNLLDKKKTGITAYDGFEPSGRMHIAQVCPSASTQSESISRHPNACLAQVQMC